MNDRGAAGGSMFLLLGVVWCSISTACAAVGDSPSGDAIELLKRSPNYDEDKFVNRLEPQDPPFFRALVEWIRSRNNTRPEQPVPVMKRTAQDFVSLPQSGLRITWIGHSTSLVEIDGVRLLLDPIWSERSSPLKRVGPERFFSPPLPLDALPPLDAVLVSHNHYDHLDMNTVLPLAEKGYRFIVPLGVDEYLLSWEIPDEQIDTLDWWESTLVEGVAITATPARHFSGRSMVMSDGDESLWVGYAMVGDVHRVLFTGDTGMFPGFGEIGKRLGPFDAVLAEIGAYDTLWADIHLGPEQAVQVVKQVRGKLLIPVHWGTFNLAFHSWVEPAERVIIAAKRTNVPLAIPKPGQSVEPANPIHLTRWWPKIPWDTAEEHSVISSGL